MNQRYLHFLQEEFFPPELLLKSHPDKQDILQAIYELRLFQKLSHMQPQLVGTQPLFIDTPQSDLDILCFSLSLDETFNQLQLLFQNQLHFQIIRDQSRSKECLVTQFQFRKYNFEIFAQEIPTQQQDAFKHMIVEGQLLYFSDPSKREDIIELKKHGAKTEPAFAQIYKLSGDPYVALLELYNKPQETFIQIASSK